LIENLVVIIGQAEIDQQKNCRKNNHIQAQVAFFVTSAEK
jgi:hypothetical protein